MKRKIPLKAIILAAGVGKRLGKETQTLPKCLIPLGKNRPHLLSRYFHSFREVGLKKVVIVCGHLKEKIIYECLKLGEGLDIKLIFNKDYKKGSILSLHRASKELDSDLLIMDADIYFPTEALKKLIESKKKNAFLADTGVKSSGEEEMLMSKNGRLFAISKRVDPSLKIVGEATGIFKLNKETARALRKILKEFVRKGKINVEYEETYSSLMRKRKIGIVPIGKLFWSEIDFKRDLKHVTRHGSF